MLAVNYRGSAGRGAKFSKAIWADWGHYEVDDLQAMVDQVVKMVVADPNKLGVGGWSYGGILTDTLPATPLQGGDQRRRHRVYGRLLRHRSYIIQYITRSARRGTRRRGRPIRRFPIRSCTPIASRPDAVSRRRARLQRAGARWQPIYQALRSLKIDTQLVIYPNEFHGITRPSYVRDRYERYLAWYELHINGKQPAALSDGPGKVARNLGPEVRMRRIVIVLAGFAVVSIAAESRLTVYRSRGLARRAVRSMRRRRQIDES